MTVFEKFSYRQVYFLCGIVKLLSDSFRCTIGYVGEYLFLPFPKIAEITVHITHDVNDYNDVQHLIALMK